MSRRKTKARPSTAVPRQRRSRRGGHDDQREDDRSELEEKNATIAQQREQIEALKVLMLRSVDGTHGYHHDGEGGEEDEDKEEEEEDDDKHKNSKAVMRKLSRHIEALSAENSVLREKARAATGAVAGLQRQYTAACNRLRTLSGESRALSGDKRALSKENQRLSEENRGLQEKLAQLQAVLSSKDAKLAQLSKLQAGFEQMEREVRRMQDRDIEYEDALHQIEALRLERAKSDAIQAQLLHYCEQKWSK
eukprot:g3087.t1